MNTSGILAALLFASYHTFSFGFLSLTSAVTHSVVNVLKRAFSLTVSVLVLDRSLPSDSFMARLLVIFSGLVLLCKHKNFVALKQGNTIKGDFVVLCFGVFVVP
jgi:drug/metabolite transporter (DMT)-like permease